MTERAIPGTSDSLLREDYRRFELISCTQLYLEIAFVTDKQLNRFNENVKKLINVETLAIKSWAALALISSSKLLIPTMRATEA